MATPLQMINAARRPVVVYAPGRGAPVQRRGAAPRRAPGPPPRVAIAPRTGQRGDTGESPWSGFAERVTSTKAAREQRERQVQETAPEEEQGGFWGSGFGKGLGFAINNPVTRAVTMPINYLQTGGRAVTYGLERLAEADLPDILEGPLTKLVDTDRTRADTRSFYEKVLKPNSDYGFGQLLPQPTDPNRLQAFGMGAAGLAGDILLDPLTYVTGGGVIASKVTKADDLVRARKALEVVAKSGDDDAIAMMAQRVKNAEEAVARGGPEFGTYRPAPRTKAERASFFGEQSLTPEGRAIIEQFPEQIERAGLRGMQHLGPEARAAFGLQESGLRIRGSDIRIPGTGTIARGLNAAGGAARAGLGRLPYGESAIMNARTPKGLEDAYGTLVRGKGGDVRLAATDVGVRNEIRKGTGEFVARSNRILSQWHKENFKGKSTAEKRAMTAAAEESPEMGALNELFKTLRENFEQVTGRTIDPKYLVPSEIYVPHKLNDKFRRTLASALKHDSTRKPADDFMKEAGFYKDDLLEGSGHLEKRRQLRPNADGSPLEFKIGDREVTIDDGTINGLNNNESLRAAFPGYEGKFFDDDPVEIARSYINSLGRQAGRDKALTNLLGSQNPLVRRMEGPLEETRQAINEAEALKREGALLSTVNEPYVPGEPVPPLPEKQLVPGSAKDRALRAERAGLAEEARMAPTPEEAAAAAGALEASPASAQLFGDVIPEEFFKTTGGKKATQERIAQAKGPGAAYAKAAAKDVAAAEEAIRESLGTLTEQAVTGVRASIAEDKSLIGQINIRINNMGKKIRQFGKVTSQNAGEVEAAINEVNKAIGDLTLRTRRTASAWKGRTTKAMKKIDAKWRNSLKELEQQRDWLQLLVEEAPTAMRDELTARTTALNKPVSDAIDDLLMAELTVPVPHNQAALLDARNTIESRMGVEGSKTLLDRYRQIRLDMRGEAEDLVTPMADDPANVLDARARYAKALEDIQEIPTRRRNNRGQITRANQQALDTAVAERQRLMLELGVSSRNPARGRTGSLIDDLHDKMVDVSRQIDAAAPADQPALQAQYDRMARQMGPGGNLYREEKARMVLGDMDAYEKAVADATVNERKALAAAEDIRARQQESIVWANEQKTLRHWTEQEGWDIGQTRTPEAVSTGLHGTPAPRPEAFGTRAGERAEQIRQGAELPPIGRIEPQRTELEALTALENVTEAAERVGTIESKTLEQANKRVRSRQTSLPRDISKEQERVAAKNAEEAEKILGPMIEDTKTYTKLAEDLTDKTKLIEKRRQTTVLRDRLNKVRRRGARSDLHATIDEIEAIAKENPLMDDAKLTQTESLLHTHRETLERTDDTKFRAQELNQAKKDAYDGKLGKVMIATLNDNWRQMHKGPLNSGDVIMDAELYKRFTNLFELSKEPRLVGRLFNAFTNLFKTYATLSPGFHVRNTIGGIFMNTADGVPLLTQLDGAIKWQKYVKGGDKWLNAQSPKVQDAFRAAMASGAGGRFEDIGVLAQTSYKAYNVAASNVPTRFSQRVGSRTEGAMRLGMALHSMERGESVTSALARLSRVHFDYTQISRADESLRRIIPFWTFMSRNLPLQIQQQWTNPRLYSYYNNLINNFSLPDEEFTPDYWTRQGAWRTPLAPGGNPLYLQPDLGFTRVESDIQMLGDAASGEFGKAFAQANPLIGATSDYINKRDSFYDRTYTDQDFTKRGGVVGAPLTAFARMLGQTNEAGQVSDNFWNYVTSLAPPLNQIDRLLPELTGGTPGSGTWTKRARYAGVPIQTLTPEVQEAEFRNQYFAMLDEEDRLRAMLQEAAR